MAFDVEKNSRGLISSGLMSILSGRVIANLA